MSEPNGEAQREAKQGETQSVRAATRKARRGHGSTADTPDPQSAVVNFSFITKYFGLPRSHLKTALKDNTYEFHSACKMVSVSIQIVSRTRAIFHAVILMFTPQIEHVRLSLTAQTDQRCNAHLFDTLVQHFTVVEVRKYVLKYEFEMSAFLIHGRIVHRAW